MVGVREAGASVGRLAVETQCDPGVPLEGEGSERQALSHGDQLVGRGPRAQLGKCPREMEGPSEQDVGRSRGLQPGPAAVARTL